MRRYHDEMRVMHDLGTFTTVDLQNALDCPLGTAGSILAQLAQKRMVDRVRISGTFLYTLSERGKKVVARLPEIDPNERVMQLEYVPGLADSPMFPNCPNCGCPGDWFQWHGKDGDIRGNWRCLGCGELTSYVDMGCDIPF